MSEDTAAPRRSEWGSLDRQQRRVLVATLAANALIFFDQAGVPVALQSIRTDFDASAAELHWVMTAELLALAVFMAIAGRVGDRYGRKRIFLGGVALFGLASVACALAPNIGFLIVARFVQGVGGAAMQPLALSNSARAVGPSRQGWAVGLLAGGGTAFLVIGPILAGQIVDLGSWRWLFVCYLPLVALSLIEGLRWITPLRIPETPPIPIRTVALLLFGLAGFVIGIVQLGDWGAVSVIPLVLGLALLGLFVRRELADPRPVIPFGLLRDKLLGSSLVALFAIQFVVLGAAVYLTLYLQHGLGVSGLTAGVVLAIAGLGSPLLSTVVGRRTDERGTKGLALGGLVAATIGLAAMAAAAATHSLLWLLPGLLVFAVSRPAVFTSASVGTLRSLPAAERGFAASLATESRQLGAVLGVAVLGAIFTLAGGSDLQAGADALGSGFGAAMVVAAIVTGLAAALVWARMPRRNPDATS